MDVEDQQVGFYVEPKTNCPHIAKRKHFIPEMDFQTIAANAPCENCGHEVENWVCLACSKRFCSRYVQGHMRAHFEETGHALCVSYSDFSFWCYGCDSYVASPAFYKLTRLLHAAKFGEEPVESNTAHSDPEQVQEHEDDERELRKKIRQLVELVRSSKHMIVFTGAGISTSAGIPDYRGPQGQWTLQATGQPRTMETVSLLSAAPTPSHMALVALQAEGVLKHVISQNTDGLHRRSGLPPDSLSELHGNANRETCEKCGREYMRDFSAHKGIGVRNNHHTGRTCVSAGCGGALRDTIINFGENLPERTLQRAFDESRQADLCLVLGSSLTVTPAADCPKSVGKRRNGKLVIVNLQKTPLDRYASVRIFARCDTVMERLMDALGLAVPPFVLRRGLLVAHRRDERGTLGITVEGMDADGTPMTLFRKARAAFPSGRVTRREASEEDAPSAFGFVDGGEMDLEGGSSSSVGDDKAIKREDERPQHADEVVLKMRFFHHYEEPPLGIRYQLQGDEAAKRYAIAYRPDLRDREEGGGWSVEEIPIDGASIRTGSRAALPIDATMTQLSDEQVTHTFAPSTKGRHEHEMALKKSSYPASAYRCDGCFKLGQGWSYHCDRCGYDLHPYCAHTE